MVVIISVLCDTGVCLIYVHGNRHIKRIITHTTKLYVSYLRVICFYQDFHCCNHHTWFCQTVHFLGYYGFTLYYFHNSDNSVTLSGFVRELWKVNNFGRCYGFINMILFFMDLHILNMCLCVCVCV